MDLWATVLSLFTIDLWWFSLWFICCTRGDSKFIYYNRRDPQ